VECAVVVVRGKARRRRIANLFKGEVRRTERVHMDVHPGPNGGAGQPSHLEQRRHNRAIPYGANNRKNRMILSSNNITDNRPRRLA
jgi:hypothetical protein